MGIPVLIYGKSGSGKTTSLRNFKEDEILYVNVERKMLPFRGKFKYVLQTEKVETIVEQMKKMPCKVAVVDDTTYLMTNMFMKFHKVMKGNSQFDLYNNIADTIWTLFESVRVELPDDVIVYIIMHEDTNDYGETKLRTIGKLLDSKVQPEGIVTICLRAMSDKGKHFFLTHSDGSDITKSPIEMWEEDKIPNDLKEVDSTIRSYYGLTAEKETK